MPISEVYNCDNMDLMAKYPNNYFELAIVDPPYGIDVNHNMGRRKGDKSSNYKKVKWDSEPPKKEYFDELFRISKNQIIWGANHFISLMPIQNSCCWFIWDKKFSEDVSFAQFEMAWTSFKTTCKKFDKSPNQLDRIHPTQKPVRLYEWLLANYAKEADKILDTHLGSGSSRIAAYNLNFDFVGCELDKDYYTQAEHRYQEHIKQMRLF